MRVWFVVECVFCKGSRKLKGKVGIFKVSFVCLDWIEDIV